MVYCRICCASGVDNQENIEFGTYQACTKKIGMYNIFLHHILASIRELRGWLGSTCIKSIKMTQIPQKILKIQKNMSFLIQNLHHGHKRLSYQFM